MGMQGRLFDIEFSQFVDWTSQHSSFPAYYDWPLNKFGVLRHQLNQMRVAQFLPGHMIPICRSVLADSILRAQSSAAQ